MRNSVLEIQSKKGSGSQVWLTSYTAPIAAMADKHADVILVGDSLSMVLYGMKSTLPTDMDLMRRHGFAVIRATKKALVVVDMPFGTYQGGIIDAYNNCATMMKRASCQAVKLEGGKEMAETIEYITQRGIPVVGHVGLKPQYFNSMGGYKVQGKDDASAKEILEDAIAVEKAGAFCIVVEGVKEELAEKITKKLKIPVIGIGASKACDGQVLVAEDLLGMTTNKKAKFVKQYANLAKDIDEAFAQYAQEVRGGKFPDKDYTY